MYSRASETINKGGGGGFAQGSHGGFIPPCEKPSIGERGGRGNTKKTMVVIGKEY